MDMCYDLIFEGQIADGCAPQNARRNLAKLLRREPDQIEILFSGKPYVLRRALDQEAAYRHWGAMKHAGLVCRLVPSNEIAAVAKPSTPAITTGAISLDKKPDSSQTASDPLNKKPSGPAPALNSLPGESAPASEPASAKPLTAPATFTECPKCHYHARGPQDRLISQGVCPACGLIIAKYLERQAESNRPPNRRLAAAPTSNTESDKPNPNVLHFDELPPGLLKLISLEFNLPPDITLSTQLKRAPTASLKRRFLAAVATLLNLFFLIYLLGLPFNILIVVILQLSSPTAHIENIVIFLGFLVCVISAWLALIYLPSRWEGLTYGQRLMRIAPVRENSSNLALPDNPTLRQRLLGNLIVLCSWPVVLFWLLFDYSRPSIADRLSMCRQIEVGAVPDKPVRKALAPLGYIFAIHVILQGLGRLWAILPKFEPSPTTNLFAIWAIFIGLGALWAILRR